MSCSIFRDESFLHFPKISVHLINVSLEISLKIYTFFAWNERKLSARSQIIKGKRVKISCIRSSFAQIDKDIHGKFVELPRITSISFWNFLMIIVLTFPCEIFVFPQSWINELIVINSKCQLSNWYIFVASVCWLIELHFYDENRKSLTLSSQA